METQKSINFIEQPEEMKVLDMDIIRGGGNEIVIEDGEGCQGKNCGCNGGKG